MRKILFYIEYFSFTFVAGQGVFRADYPMGNYSQYVHNHPPDMVFRGNPVIPRGDYLPSSAFRKTFIDANTQLSTGLLKEIMFYTHGVNTAPIPGMNKLRLQIWKPVGDAGDNMYELVWEHQERGLEVGPVGTLWRVRIRSRWFSLARYSITLPVQRSTFVGFLCTPCRCIVETRAYTDR